MPISLHIQKDTGIPIYVQLEQQIRLLMRQGVLTPGDLMPTVRSLAVELEVNSNTVARVYHDLQRDGLLVLRRGIGTYVADSGAAEPIAKRDLRGLEGRIDGLIKQSRQLGMTPVELFQLIETRWKEQSDA